MALKSKNIETFKQGLTLGLVAAGSIVAIDSLVSRIPVANGTATGRTLARLGIAAATAGLALKWDAPDAVPEGIISGVVSYVAIGAMVSTIGSTRPSAQLHPPPVRHLSQIGNPWEPAALV